jgi:branched-chain amino acid transport system substrate-binding protein
MTHGKWSARFAVAAVGLLLSAGATAGGGTYDPGAGESEIRIGNTAPYSGPGSAYGALSKAAGAYFKKVNDDGGINHRKITFVTYDDGFSPPRTFDQTRRLVEQDRVLLVFLTTGTASNTVIWKYLNERQVPQLFVGSGAAKFGDPSGHPWTIGWQPNFQMEARIYARYILETLPRARIGLLYQNDDYGKDYVRGFKKGLGDKTRMIVLEQTYEVTDATVDSQVANLKASGADVLFQITAARFATQVIRKTADLGWRPTHFISNPATSVGTVLRPAGLQASKGLISTFYLKDPDDPLWRNDTGVGEWRAWMQRYYPDGDVHDMLNVWGYAMAQTMVHVLKAAGDDLTRANVMKQAAHITDLELPILLPGIKLNTNPMNFYPIQQMQLGRFDGERWVVFGNIINMRSMSGQ